MTEYREALSGWHLLSKIKELCLTTESIDENVYLKTRHIKLVTKLIYSMKKTVNFLQETKKNFKLPKIANSVRVQQRTN